MKKTVIIACAAVAVLLCAALVFLLGPWGLPTPRNAEKRVRDFTELVDYHADEPGKIYDYLAEAYRESITRKDFIAAFEKERSYPYLTPFFINLVLIEMGDDNKSGVAIFSQAARLPGMVYEMPFLYENGNYYMIMEEYAGFPDGGYLEKFERIPHYLTEGWDE
ncbi:MAG: hypothetical protein LBN26_00270 [Christensenellaceae bacterium]|jgi:hypothetical protein|nr:hypothetical protein [Christensenellaceae bacterium]